MSEAPVRPPMQVSAIAVMNLSLCIGHKWVDGEFGGSTS